MAILETAEDIKIRELIKSKKHPSHLTTNKKEISVRCPYCGDSTKSASATHFYIALFPPYKFYCQKCNTGGVLNNQTLRDLGIFDSEASLTIATANKRLRGIQPQNVSKYKKPNLVKTNSDLSRRCTEYFNNRYNTNFENEYIVDKFRAITDAPAFFRENHIKPIGRYDFQNAIGFLSSDGTHVIFRDISGKQPKRYFNLNLNQDEEGISNKIYNIKSSIDILAEEINLVMTEGIFDIIGVYENFYRGTEKEKNTIFAACCGKGYNAVAAYYARKGFLNLNIEIYSDSDVDVSFLKSIKEQSIFMKGQQINVYFNTIEKDFGVSKDKINIRRARI